MVESTSILPSSQTSLHFTSNEVYALNREGSSQVWCSHPIYTTVAEAYSVDPILLMNHRRNALSA